MLDCERIIKELEAPAAAPLHARLRGAIQAQLMDGTLKPGETLPAERALQEELGISRATIRQAIKSLTNDGFLKSVVGAGTFVLEQQQSPPHNILVGVIVPDSNYYIYYPALASSLNHRLRSAGYRVDTSIHNDRYETLAEVAASLVAQEVAAVVVVAPSEQDGNRVLRQLRAKGVTLIFLTRYLEKFDDVDYVGADNRHIGYEATRHLIELGHRGIVHVGASRTSTAFDRASGYVQAMQQANLTPQIFLAPEERSPVSPDLESYLLDTRSSQLWEKLARKEVTGLFCFNDQIASWVQKEVRKLDLVVPRDLSLISVDNMPYANFFDTPLTTFALPGAEIGEKAASLLLRRLKGETFPAQRILLPATFIQRHSTAAPPQAAKVQAS